MVFRRTQKSVPFSQAVLDRLVDRALMHGGGEGINLAGNGAVAPLHDALLDGSKNVGLLAYISNRSEKSRTSVKKTRPTF